jgi:hypothetical protein
MIDAAKNDINASIDQKLELISKRLDEVSSKADDAEGQLKRLRDDVNRQAREQQQQASLAMLTTPESGSQVLAEMRAAISAAQVNNKPLPVSELTNFKQGIQAIRPSVRDYWATVAAIINYQSYLNQKDRHAPDPSTVAHKCGGLTAGTGGNNLIQGYVVIKDCILDLDKTHNTLQGLTFQDSVIRYGGGQLTGIRNLTFVNCYFILDMPLERPPFHPEILIALLDSNQQRVNLSTVPLGPTPN